MCRSQPNLPWPVVAVAFLAAAFLTVLVWAGDTGPWSGSATTEGRVEFIKSRWSSQGGSAWVVYEVEGQHVERWLPDVAEEGKLEVGDPYLVEYRN